MTSSGGGDWNRPSRAHKSTLVRIRSDAEGEKNQHSVAADCDGENEKCIARNSTSNNNSSNNTNNNEQPEKKVNAENLQFLTSSTEVRVE